jgi:hypothetical protein
MGNGQQPATRPLGGGEPGVDFNGTKYTNIEGSAADNNISIRRVDRSFDPLQRNGIALTNTQAKELGVKIGQTVTVHDNWTNTDVEATYYDNAGRDGNRVHFEVSPKLADTLGLSYRNKKGDVIDAVIGSERMRGRFEIRKR